MEEQEVVEEVVEEVAPVEEVDNALTDGEESGEEVTEPEESGEVVEEPDVQAGVEKKLAKLTKKRRDAEREAEYWREQAMANKAPVTPEKPAENLPPQAESFDNYDDYLRATARFEAKQELAQEQARSKEAEQANAHNAKVQGAIRKGNEKYDDFDEVSRAIPLSKYALVAATETEAPEEVVYFLGKNPGEAERIASLPPFQQVREIYRIENRLSSPPPKRTTKAPAPIEPVTSTGKTELQYSPDMSDKEYAEWRARHKK